MQVADIDLRHLVQGSSENLTLRLFLYHKKKDQSLLGVRALVRVTIKW